MLSLRGLVALVKVPQLSGRDLSLPVSKRRKGGLSATGAPWERLRCRAALVLDAHSRDRDRANLIEGSWNERLAGWLVDRTRLYRSQILQENIRWKALDGIYKIYMLLHRSDLNISEKSRQTFSHFSAFFFCKIYSFPKHFHFFLLRV